MEKMKVVIFENDSEILKAIYICKSLLKLSGSDSMILQLNYSRLKITRDMEARTALSRYTALSLNRNLYAAVHKIDVEPINIIPLIGATPASVDEQEMDMLIGRVFGSDSGEGFINDKD